MTGVKSQQPDFYNSLLDTRQFKIEINKNLGATINQITTGAFKQMQFFVPSLKEQTAIGTLFRQLDAAIASHQRKPLASKYVKNKTGGHDIRLFLVSKVRPNAASQYRCLDFQVLE